MKKYENFNFKETFRFTMFLDGKFQNIPILDFCIDEYSDYTINGNWYIDFYNYRLINHFEFDKFREEYENVVLKNAIDVYNISLDIHIKYDLSFRKSFSEFIEKYLPEKTENDIAIDLERRKKIKDFNL